MARAYRVPVRIAGKDSRENAAHSRFFLKSKQRIVLNEWNSVLLLAAVNSQQWNLAAAGAKHRGQLPALPVWVRCGRPVAANKVSFR